MQHLTRPVPRRRIALYSHDTQGLGHIRRNISIASALVGAHPDTDVLLLSGAPEATCLPLPPNSEVITLPALRKNLDGHYGPRVLGLPLEEVVELRRQISSAALLALRPDLLIVDKVARGFGGELEGTLRSLRRGGTRTVLGLRDVLDSPAVTAAEWRSGRTDEAIRDLYDEVWVYGDPVVFDAAQAYGWSWAVRTKIAYTGYLADHVPDPCAVAGGQDNAPPSEPYVLCLVGGGQDGAQLAEAFVESGPPPGHTGVLVTGPYMSPGDRERLVRTSRRRSDLLVHGFTARARELVAGAAATVTMGGYNSVCELLAAGCPTLVAPRVRPRMEQAIRASALSRMGRLDVLLPHELTPQRIRAWLERAVAPASTTTTTTGEPSRSHPCRPAIDLAGLSRIPVFAHALLTSHLLEANHAAV